MSYQCAWSARFSQLERYRGFFPSFADRQIDVSSDRLADGTRRSRCLDFTKDGGNGQVSAIHPSVYSVQSKSKQSGGIRRQGGLGVDLEAGSGRGTGSRGNSSGGGSGSSSGGDGGGTGPGSAAARVRGVSRKAKTPRRSARRNDPRFRGVTFSVGTNPCHKSQLSIRSSYSVKISHSDVRTHLHQARMKRRSMLSSSSSSSSSSCEEPDTADGVTRSLTHYDVTPNSCDIQGGKQCASCCTRRTPLWRDAEDGTPLCNACGIRYKKYRIRCITCWNIPKKDGKSSRHVCSRCGHMLRITMPKRAGLY